MPVVAAYRERDLRRQVNRRSEKGIAAQGA
jgi:hypothetical protein